MSRHYLSKMTTLQMLLLLLLLLGIRMCRSR
jgi:hypothetical protein